MDVWVESEVSSCEFPDRRLKDRFGELLSSVSQKIGDTIPTACQDWAATKAAYRFSAIRESMKLVFCQVISLLLQAGIRKHEGRFWCFTTRRNSAFNVNGLKQLES